MVTGLLREVITFSSVYSSVATLDKYLTCFIAFISDYALERHSRAIKPSWITKALF